MKIQKRVLHIIAGIMAIVGLSQTGSSTAAPEFPAARHYRYVIQTAVQDPYRLTQLSRWLEHNNFDVAGMNWRQGEVEVVTSDAGVGFLTARGLHGHRFAQTEAELRPDAHYLNPESLATKMKALAQAYPQLTHLEVIGTSLQGRPIYALEVSDTPNPNDPRQLEKPTILFDGLHHAREIMTPEIVLDVAETFLKGSETSQKARALLHQWNIWLVPMVNVDGSNIVWTKDSMWRKNAHADASEIYGVDINRNYNYRWNDCHGSGTSKDAQDYHGGAAASEPETQALQNLAQRIRPTASLSYHSYSEFVLYPYGCNGDFPSEKELVERIANELAQRLPSDSGRGQYTPGTPWQLLYDVDGSSMDYMYAEFGALAYTFEINQSFQPPYSDRDPTVAKHRVAWSYFIQRIDQNLLTVKVVDGKTGRPSEALIAVNTIPHNKGELPFRTNRGGYYFKVLDPGQYVIAAQLSDGRQAQVSVQMNGQPQAQTLTIP